jgi:addiction module RelE/StbE family toxin
MKVAWTEAALADVQEAHDFMAAESPKGAARVTGRITQAIARLADAPRMGKPGRIEGTREFAVGQTPYLLLYEIEADQILLLRVMHGARRWPE